MSMVKRLKDFLNENNVDYDVERHRELFTAQEVAASEHITGYEFAKVVMLKADGEDLMAVVPAPYDVDTEKVKSLGYKKVKLSEEEEFKDIFPDCETGAQPPFGNLYDLTFYVDEFLKDEDEIVFNSGTHTETVKISGNDFRNLIGKGRYKDIKRD